MLNLMFKILPRTQASQAGFTLIELMIAAIVVSIIASVGFVTYSNAQAAARDAKRKSDLRAISTALEVYYQKNGRYPCNGAAGREDSTGTNGFWIADPGHASCETGSTGAKPLNGLYINVMPHDPKNTASGLSLGNNTSWGYKYSTAIPPGGSSSCPAVGQYYVLYTRLENVNDADSCKNKAYKSCDGTTALCDPATQPGEGIFVITSK